MDLLREINTAAETWIPTEEPIIEMHPMTKMMLKAMDADRYKKQTQEDDKKKKSKKPKKSLSDYLNFKSPKPA